MLKNLQKYILNNKDFLFLCLIKSYFNSHIRLFFLVNRSKIMYECLRKNKFIFNNYKIEYISYDLNSLKFNLFKKKKVYCDIVESSSSFDL
jgi:hypothetical protein